MSDNKAKRWALTVFEAQYKLLEEVAKDQLFVKQIGWQDEICGTTGKKHRQAYMITQQPVRFSAIRSRLPGVHVEICRDLAALKKYCSKEESRDPESVPIEATHPPTHVRVDMFMEMIAQVVIEFCSDKSGNPPTNPDKKALKEEYWMAVGEILRFRPELAALAMAPGPLNLYQHTRNIWLWRAKRANGDEGISITPKSPVTPSVPKVTDADLISLQLV